LFYRIPTDHEKFSGGARRGLGGLAPQMGRSVPTVKRTGQESEGKLCEIFKF